MKLPPKLTDVTALTRFRARAANMPEPAMFLQEEAADEVIERLNLVNRVFKSISIITPFPKVWQNLLPSAKVVPDSDVIEIEPNSCDLVIHSMSLHWANDPIGQMIQCRRALKPDGLFLGVSFGGQTIHELRTSLSEAEIAITGGLSPRVLPMGEIREFGSLLQRAEFALPVADSVTKTVSYSSMTGLMHDLRSMGETNALHQRNKTCPARTLFEVASKIYTDNFGDENNRISATFELIFLTGWAPDHSQPKPLRPGSANTRLAQVLSTLKKPL